MTIGQVQDILGAKLLCGRERLDEQVDIAFASDLMSDVLAFVREGTLLITGLVNPHVIRTAEMLDVGAIVFVRNKQPDEDVMTMARARDMLVLQSSDTMFEVCGRLYMAGMRGCTLPGKGDDAL
nr:DRTGG domain-containing protein [Maliibacterium massiliense]